jgi:hypothetical protein
MEHQRVKKSDRHIGDFIVMMLPFNCVSLSNRSPSFILYDELQFSLTKYKNIRIRKIVSSKYAKDPILCIILNTGIFKSLVPDADLPSGFFHILQSYSVAPMQVIKIVNFTLNAVVSATFKDDDHGDICLWYLEGKRSLIPPLPIRNRINYISKTIAKCHIRRAPHARIYAYSWQRC